MTIDGNRMARRRSGAGPWLAMALTCGGLVVVDLALVRDAFLTLGASYRDVVSADAASQLYELPGAEPRFDRLRLRRTDEVLVTSGEVAVVQATLAWVDPDGQVPLSQTTGLYGVARARRQNVSGYGDQERSGDFFPPPDPPRARLVLWDAFHPGPLSFTFANSELREGVELLRYGLAADGSEEVDASATYDQFPLVPERYLVHARVEKATLWIEPRTGRVVDREQRSIARFVITSDGTPVGDAHTVSWRYSPEDRARLLAAARKDLRLLWVIEQAIPTVLGLLALAAAALGMLRWARRDG